MANDIAKYFLVLVLGIALGILIGLNFIPPQIIEVPIEIQVPVAETVRSAEMFLPAVTSEGAGVLFPFGVEVKIGTGKTLVDLGNLVFIDDTQSSIKKSHDAVAKVTGQDLRNYDITYFSNTIQPTVISGESAGAAMTILTIAALENKTIPPGITITGAITNNGSIVKVGAVAAKAKVIGELGYSTFIVPKGQSTDVLTQKVCEQTSGTENCNEVKGTVMAKDLVQNVVEVSSIYEALPYFRLD